MTELAEHLANGGLAILAGDALRGGDLDLAAAASRITPDAIAFMARNGRGLICLGLSAERAAALGIEPQQRDGHGTSGRPFGQSIEAKEGVTTGISAADRATTIKVAVDPARGREDLVSPGHVFPLIANPGGPAVRLSTLEAGLEIIRSCGLGEGVVLCAMLREDGSMARIGELTDWAAEQGIPIVDIGEWTRGQGAR
ncbi:3,4-dihydroxy-2-butanone-4-phosphate synthase [Sphingomonas sp. BN140010]|uniref:3,4-dihydroxy-2-butanone 4-phosphate synthase n=1 Tax=Sphingomonas arvum TaxID=2992113 RepID=A0ABT3JEX1_9SPHN|nr:3,4-dihydroxy-2-butanone-4-phosphate synthase [Sphingomonas sp. BN140010]MCW3797581.1 3,4-dihydroxy-2-butanone-4-phosphate synthase [Sphingomonas sp. BN140010]